MKSAKGQSYMAQLQRFCVLIPAVCTALFLLHAPVQAQDYDPSCSGSYMNTLKARAWLEGQREITQNQNLIYKPDSVLEYSCFNYHLKKVPEEIAKLFSEENEFFSWPFPSMERAVIVAVEEPLLAYNFLNFGHTYLGGRLDPPAAPGAVGGIMCSAMDYVWTQAKCVNFISNADGDGNPNTTVDKDGFYTFQEYADEEDRRFLPEQCADVSRWEANIRFAFENSAAGGNPDWVKPFRDTVVASYNTYAAMTSPASSSGECVPPIFTGIQARRYGSSQRFADAVCMDPNCKYVPSGLPAGAFGSPDTTATSTSGSCVLIQ